MMTPHIRSHLASSTAQPVNIILDALGEDICESRRISQSLSQLDDILMPLPRC